MKWSEIKGRIACCFGNHNLEVRRSQVPWIKMAKRERCRREHCGYLAFYILGKTGFSRVGYHPTTMVWGPKMNFDTLDKFCKEIS